MSEVSPVLPTRSAPAAPPAAAPPVRRTEALEVPDPQDRVALRGAPRTPPAERPAPPQAAAPAAAPQPVVPRTLLAEEPARPLRLEAGVRGIDRGNMDPSVPAGQDFYRHAVGGYLKTHPIPADRPSYGVDAELQERTRQNLRGILEELAAKTDHPPGSNEQKLADFYATAMDQAALDAAGAEPIRPLLDRIAAIQDPAGLQEEVARLHQRGIGAMFSFYATQDARNSEQMIGELFQGGLGLPDRDYYLKDEKDSRRVLEAYRRHVDRMFQLLGQTPEEAERSAQTVIEVETALAAVSLGRVDLRDPDALYNVKDREALAKMTPDFSWPDYLARRGVPEVESLNVTTPKFFEGLNGALRAIPLENWKTYLSWKVLDNTASELSRPFSDEDFHFSGKVLKGLEARPERWKEVVGLTDGVLGDALGQKFVERHFPPEAKARVQEMVDDIKGALREKVQGLSWMDDATKEGALAKIGTFTAKIGYPDKWQDYGSLEIRRGDHLGNILRSHEFAVRDNLSQIGQPVDRNRWYMTAPTINAYYSAATNEIVFPAGILQPPYFDLNADDAMNYGGIGATIGHELSHGFDDEGSKFDKDGNLHDWWSPESKARFQRKADGVVKQFDEFSFDGIPVQGKLVAGESIADLGGLELAHAALQKARARHPERTADDGFTSDQRFYLSYALSWATNMRPEYAKLILQTDPHPLPEFRVNGPLANLPSFHRAFDLQPGDAMVRPEDKRNSIWD